LRLDPNFVPALVNLADLDRARDRDDEGAELLRKGAAIEPDNADVRYALGLWCASTTIPKRSICCAAPMS
jgi:hypothetical protein